MQSKYEVQFVDSFGCWRRWSLCLTAEAAAQSMAKLERFGVTSGRVLLVTR